MKPIAIPMLVALAIAGPAAAQESAQRGECDGRWGGARDRAHVCEVRELSLPADGALSVDAGPNGGIEVIGADRRDVLVRATVRAWSDNEDAARELAGAVSIATADVIHAEGPEHRRDQGWSVSYEILAPRDTDLTLETVNGGIALTNVRGDLDFEALNGGIVLDSVAGNVRGHTMNGGVEVKLAGTRWDGDALDVHTTNGGIQLRVPEEYSARLETGTVNGGLSFDFPITVQGRLNREISTMLGEGGALVRARTTNGGVHVTRY
jgi:hypothetical protein